MDTTQQTTQEEQHERTQTNNNTSCLNNNSLIPALQESENFINFLIKRFNIENTKPFLIVINKTTKSALGSFASKETRQHFIKNEKDDLNTITLNTLNLHECNPYEVLAHELAHYINYCKGVKDCSSNQYHNKHFKEVAETLLLSTERTSKGYTTQDNEVFNNMVTNEFKSNPAVFKIFQSQKERQRAGSRLRLYMCSCGVKVRVADDDFKAKCLKCEGEFLRC